MRRWNRAFPLAALPPRPRSKSSTPITAAATGEAARAAAQRFIRLHPDSENIDYAYYMLGLSSFDDNSGFLDRFVPVDPTKRDPGRTEESFNDFSPVARALTRTAPTPPTPGRG